MIQVADILADTNWSGKMHSNLISSTPRASTKRSRVGCIRTMHLSRKQHFYIFIQCRPFLFKHRNLAVFSHSYPRLLARAAGEMCFHFFGYFGLSWTLWKSSIAIRTRSTWLSYARFEGGLFRAIYMMDVWTITQAGWLAGWLTGWPTEAALLTILVYVYSIYVLYWMILIQSVRMTS